MKLFLPYTRALQVLVSVANIPPERDPGITLLTVSRCNQHFALGNDVMQIHVSFPIAQLRGRLLHACSCADTGTRRATESGRKSVLLVMSQEIRYRSEKLANILNRSPSPADELKRFLSECSSNGFSLVRLINYQIPRYNGRTVVHIAANNGLFKCLEELLRLGGEYTPCIMGA